MSLTIAGRRFDDPMQIWREYATRHSRTIHEYDLAGPGDPHSITDADIRRTRVIGSRISGGEGALIVERANDAGCPWLSVPEDARLADAEPTVSGALFDQAAELYWYFTKPPIPDVHIAKIHKAVHIKRPHLYPILDTHLRSVYRERARPWVRELSRLKVTLDDSPPFWAGIRQDLLDNEPALDAYVRRLKEETHGAVRRMADLSRLRLLDILAWKIAPARSSRRPG